MTGVTETPGTYHLPESLPADFAKLDEMSQRLKTGEVSDAQFKAFRVPLGVYEQRRDGTYMLRVRLPAGGMLPHQMRKLADVSRTYGNGTLHVTTRQDIQVHEVALEGIHPALVELATAGLATKGGGGNTVRNITACYDSGVCAAEKFDVSPCAIALTEALLPDPLSYQLPRKYKIALSGCPNDCAGATVSDVGLIGKQKDGRHGFAVHVGGGLGAHSRVADPFEDFVPVEEIHLVAEAVKRVFDKNGNRKNKNKARLRFLIEGIGLERFRALYEEELAQLRSSETPRPEIRPLRPVPRPAQEAVEEMGDGYREWVKKHVVPQKQEEYFLIDIPLSLGDIHADTLEKLAVVVDEHGEGMVRTTQSQNLVLRWVPDRERTSLHGKLGELGLAAAEPAVLRNMVACTGASTCRLGICLSRGLVSAIRRRLTSDGLDLDALGDFRINVSGCPNSCGRHAIGHVGAFGAARRVEGRLVPHYVLQFGGKVEEGSTALAQGTLSVPSRNIPEVLARLLGAFQNAPQFPDFGAFLEAGGREEAERLAREHRTVPAFEDDRNYYYDWGAEELFSLAGRGPGECSAGVFDLIEVDLASAEEACQSGRRFAAAALAARALLVTQGHEAKDDADALQLFIEGFMDSGLVDESYRGLIDAARQCARSADPEAAFKAESGPVEDFVGIVRQLYDNMDPSLRFTPVKRSAETPDEPEDAGTAEGESPVEIDREADFRGVVCPLNYVKTKLVLGQMESGQVLSVLLDEEGCRNVPESAEKDGHQALSVKEEGPAWRVTLKKA